MLRLDTDDQLAAWRGPLRRQVDLVLGPVRHSLKSLHVRFRSINGRGAGGTRFQCEVRGRSPGGQAWAATARHADGYIAIRDALARIRRAVARDRQRQRQLAGGRPPSGISRTGSPGHVR